MHQPTQVWGGKLRRKRESFKSKKELPCLMGYNLAEGLGKGGIYLPVDIKYINEGNWRYPIPKTVVTVHREDIRIGKDTPKRFQSAGDLEIKLEGYIYNTEKIRDKVRAKIRI